MTDIALPQLGETVIAGTITQWFKQVGDVVAADEPLFEISTDKVDTEVPSPVAGIVTEILAAAGDTIEVGTVVAVVEDVAGASSELAPEPAAAAAAPVEITHESAEARDNRLLSPVVRRLVNEHGLDPNAIENTGLGGRITRADVLDHIDTHHSTPAPPAVPAPTLAPAPLTTPLVSADDRAGVVRLSKIRRLTGHHMVMSKATSPHAWSVVEVDFANVDATRNKVKADFKTSEGFSLTYLPFVCRAIIDGLAEFPRLNASLSGDELLIHQFVDLGIAVDLDHEGLLAPVVRSADTKRLTAMAHAISDLASRARERKLGPDEVQGGTFTISNNGSAGSVLSMPIINQPQVAIVSTDAIVRKPNGGACIADGRCCVRSRQ